MRKYIGILDLLLLGVILFGPAIFNSLKTVKDEQDDSEDMCEFSKKENIYALIMQSIQLFIALIYLKLRGVNPFQFSFHISTRSFLFALGLFCIYGLCMDILTSLKYGFSWIFKILLHNIPVFSALKDVNLSLVLISMLNGFYEEFFFLAVWSYIDPKYSVAALVFMIIIRILIHTYQGWPTALAIGIGLGMGNYILFTQFSDNLFIYSLAHIIADIFGLSLFNLL